MPWYCSRKHHIFWDRLFQHTGLQEGVGHLGPLVVFRIPGSKCAISLFGPGGGRVSGVPGVRRRIQYVVVANARKCAGGSKAESMLPLAEGECLSKFADGSSTRCSSACASLTLRGASVIRCVVHRACEKHNHQTCQPVDVALSRGTALNEAVDAFRSRAAVRAQKTPGLECGKGQKTASG